VFLSSCLVSVFAKLQRATGKDFCRVSRPPPPTPKLDIYHTGTRERCEGWYIKFVQIRHSQISDLFVVVSHQKYVSRQPNHSSVAKLSTMRESDCWWIASLGQTKREGGIALFVDVHILPAFDLQEVCY